MKLRIVITLVLALLCGPIFAGVNYKNGNWYITYTDLVVPGSGQDLEITRTYNSKSVKVGWFGFGWGSDFETYLDVNADGSVVIHENGSGADTRFTPKSAIDPEAAAKKILAAVSAKENLSKQVLTKLRKDLKNDAELRHSYAKRYGVQANLAVGTVLYSNDRGLQQLHVVSEGYKRVNNDGKADVFDKNGNLIQIKDKNGYKISLSYDKEGNLKKIKDSAGKWIDFAWYPSGRIKNVWSSGGKKAQYKYKGDDLIESKDVGDNLFKFSYDSNHNMTEVLYSDKTSLKISYTKDTQFVSSVVERDGEETRFKYWSNPKNPDFHYGTNITKKDINGKDITDKFEYEIKTRPDGSQYTYRIKTEVDKLLTETIYSECCSLPLKITRGNQVATFEYNNDGLLTKKASSDGKFTQLEYHPTLKKIVKVTNNEGVTEFGYDKKGNMTKAKNGAGESVFLMYDRKGQITKLISANSKKKGSTQKLLFKYNAQGRPIEIDLAGRGKVNVDYDNYGEIKRVVPSTDDEELPLMISDSFKKVQDIVKPGGVSLSL